MNKLQEKIFLSIGAASMCWDEIPTGVYDSTKAKKIAEDLCRDVEHLIKALNHPDIAELPCECDYYEGEENTTIYHQCLKCYAEYALKEAMRETT